MHTSNQLSHPADNIFSTEPLGAIYTPEQTIFRVWAPTAGKVTLKLYDSPSGGRPRLLSMSRHRDGTWSAMLLGDWRGIYYNYSAGGRDPRFDLARELIDPYARAVTAHNGRAIVVRDETPVADRPAFPISEAIIYETHVRDFTIDPDSGIQRRGKYLGLTEAGAHLTGRSDIATGLDHLVEMGVNVVQLQPISEFANDEPNDRYGWGYDVVHHNSPDGWYATERYDASRVAEVKRMIDALHRRGIRVTLDVVFNHTFEAAPKHRIYSFEGLVPGYYYRMKHDGGYWNGSGTGNEFRTEAPMARRYIIDSVKYWVNEYKVDGFRFDLLGLIDLETFREVVRELRAIDPNLLIYGEPWAGGATPIEINGKGAQRGGGWAIFNDHFRDVLKGNVFEARATGFIQSGFNVDEVKKGIRGAVDDFADSPLEAVNYVECHDNHTLWDRLLISTADDATVTAADRRAMDKFAAAIIFTSQGIPFIQSGQEFLRTKGGDHNSYDKPDSVNMMRWREKADQHDVVEYYRGLIELRRAHPLFRLETADEARDALKFLDDQLGVPVPEGCIGFLIEDGAGRDEWSRALVLLNPQAKVVEFAIPEGEWKIFGDAMRAGNSELRQSAAKLSAGRALVTARSALILGEPRRKTDDSFSYNHGDHQIEEVKTS
ncbi:MAG TPA: type I pullulanase [Blastocatellia bacterium]|nr:type I pullulanase [Blastocatellia bacterium]